MNQAPRWTVQLGLLAILGYFLVWPWYRDGDPTRLLVFIIVYAAGGVLTLFAAAIIFHNQHSSRVTPQRDSWGQLCRTAFKVFALWPWVFLMAVVFAAIMLGQRRRNRAPPEPSPPLAPSPEK